METNQLTNWQTNSC